MPVQPGNPEHGISLSDSCVGSPRRSRQRQCTRSRSEVGPNLGSVGSLGFRGFAGVTGKFIAALFVLSAQRLLLCSASYVLVRRTPLASALFIVLVRLLLCATGKHPYGRVQVGSPDPNQAELPGLEDFKEVSAFCLGSRFRRVAFKGQSLLSCFTLQPLGCRVWR